MGLLNDLIQLDNQRSFKRQELEQQINDFEVEYDIDIEITYHNPFLIVEPIGEENDLYWHHTVQKYFKETFNVKLVKIIETIINNPSNHYRTFKYYYTPIENTHLLGLKL